VQFTSFLVRSTTSIFRISGALVASFFAPARGSKPSASHPIDADANTFSRTVLSALRFHALGPKCFERTRYGRPFISYPRSTEPLHFSLSHTDGFVACVVSSCERIGVDVEATDRPVAHLEIARTFFSSEELADLISVPPAQQKDRLFDFWTLKEAYAKARGLGFHLPLNEFSIRVAPGGKRGISFSGDLCDDPESWRFSQFSPSPRHRLAVADGSGCGLPLVSEPWPIQSQATFLLA
jgi:4'-phosphopantetheinyl transferase